VGNYVTVGGRLGGGGERKESLVLNAGGGGRECGWAIREGRVRGDGVRAVGDACI